MKKRFLSMFALLLMAATGAWAQTETLLTTITATGQEQASYSTANVATVSFSYTANGYSAYLANWGWWGYGWSATVTAAEGYTITKCVFYDNTDHTATDSEAPFVVETTENDKQPKVNGNNIYQYSSSAGIKKIDVYGYVKYSVTLADGTEDAGNWTISPAKAEEGATVTATYSGEKKVKSVKAVKKAASLIVNPVVGQIIGSDGKNYDANATLPTGVTAVAKIAYVGNDAETSTTYNHGLALALEDVPGTTINWCSQTDATCLGTGHQFDSEAGAKGDMAGIANTDALVNNTGHTHAAASAARNYNSGTHPAGTSAWFLPSAGQWNKMFTAAGGYENLKANASLQNDDENYWSSTEYNAGGAWDFYSDGGSWYHNSKSSSYDRVRPCLAF